MFDSLVYIDCCGFYLLIYIARSLSSKDLLYANRWNPFSFFLIGNMMSLLGYNLSYILMKK